MEDLSSGREDLRAELERAKREIETLRDLADSRKLRYERREAELERLRHTLPHRANEFVRRALGRNDLRAFCLFVGYPRSGHSLLGSLLDAHPDVAIAHGANVLKLIAGGTDGPALVDMLVRAATAEADRKGGRRATGYSYAVPGQWQGDVRRLRVVGAKAGDKTTSALGRDPAAIERLQRLTKTRVRLLHATRNPFDMIARMALITKDGRPERTLAASVKFTARLARINGRLIADRPGDILTVRHETLVQEPRAALQRICDFLAIAPEADWLEACADLVFPAPKHARHLIEWPDEERTAVEGLIARHSFFDGYTFTSDG